MVTLATLWKRGRLMVEDTYPWIKQITTHVSATENSSILTPYGTSLIISSLSQGNLNNIDGSLSTSPFKELQYTPTPKDVTVGMVQLEDIVADVKYQYNQSNSLGFSNTVWVEGIIMNKSRAIVQQFRYVTSASSTNRLQHVA